MLEWFRSFLTNRHQHVQINGAISSWVRAKNGIPQGPAVSPLMFALHVNELPFFVSSPLLLLADDIKLYHIIWPSDDCLQLQHNKDVLAQWSKMALVILSYQI